MQDWWQAASSISLKWAGDKGGEMELFAMVTLVAEAHDERADSSVLSTAGPFSC